VPSKQEVILPRKTVLELQRLLKDEETPIEMRFAGNQAKFSFSGMEFVTKLVEGKFPDYNRVIPKNHKNSVTLGRAPLLASLQRAAILTSEKFKGVRVNIEPGVLRIASSNAEQEEAKEELEVDYNGDAIEIGFNVTYLIDVLANMQRRDGQARTAGQQRQRAVHRARATRLQVRRDADAHLSASQHPPTTAGRGPLQRLNEWACKPRPEPEKSPDDRPEQAE
jgi:DNA polymerase III beta subunit